MAKAKFKTGELVLAPIAPIWNIVTKSTSGSFLLGEYGDFTFSILPPPKPAHGVPVDKWPSACMLAAFWWILSDTTTDEAAANMHIVTKRFGGKSLKVMVNSKPVNPGVRLVLKKEAEAAAAPLNNVISSIKAVGPPREETQEVRATRIADGVDLPTRNHAL